MLYAILVAVTAKTKCIKLILQKLDELENPYCVYMPCGQKFWLANFLYE